MSKHLEEKLIAVEQGQAVQPDAATSFVNFSELLESNVASGGNSSSPTSGAPCVHSEVQRYLSSPAELDVLDPIGWWIS